VYAGSILVATVVQLLMPLPMLRGLDGRIRPVLESRDPAVRRFFVLMLPVTLTLGLINVNAVIGTLFASRLIDPELAPAAIDKAFRLYMLPQGMFSVAVATVLFPTLSRLAARRDVPGFRRQIDEGLRLIGFLLVPASLVSAALAVPITRVVYERGAFTAEDTEIVAQCLAAFSIGLVFNGWMLMLTRGFYALQSNWAPTLVALGSLVLNVLLNVGFYRLGVWGLPLATSIANVVGVVALLVLMRRRTGFDHPRTTAGALLRILALSVVATAAAWGVWRALDELLGTGGLGGLVAVGLGLAVATVAYLGLARPFQVREVEALKALLPTR
jgi:putative peptidoglycan lipid II flippase